MAGKVTCDECLKAFDPPAMFNDEFCLRCAKTLGELSPRNNAAEFARVEEEMCRVNKEEKEAFDLEEEAKRERADRELCQRHLLPFVTRCNEDYIPGWVHADICMRLEKFAQEVEAGLSPRLMITMPPRHGKSELCSKTFPSWYLGRNSTHEAILCSYSGDLAEDFSRKCRDLIEDPRYTSVFKTRLSKDSKSVKKWATKQGGGFTAAGVQGPITGRGAHVGIIDDPVKDREEAESDTTRRKVKDWYSSTFYTRLAPGGGILIIQTRWHEDDLSGWLLGVMREAEQEAIESGVWPEDADRWELVEYPAVALEDEKFRKAGEALHPDRYPLPALRKIKRAMIPRDWEALYQQRPVSDEGDYFKKEDFRFYDAKELPERKDLRIYAAGDLAISTKQDADYTVFIVVGVDRKHNIWVMDMHRDRWGSLDIINKLFEIQEVWDPDLIGLEEGQIELTLEPFIIKAQEEKKMSLRYEKMKTRGQDKRSRARTIQGRMQQGKVHFPKVGSVSWMAQLYNEMLKFDSGKNDDCVDTMAWLGLMILLFSPVYDRPPKKKKSWQDKAMKYVTKSGSHKSSMSA